MVVQDGIAWIVHTHEHKDRSADWYWTLGLVALVTVGVSVYFGNYLFALIISIAALSVGTLTVRGPRTHWVRIDARGLSMDGTLYPYRSLKSYWVDHAREPRLFITTTGFLRPQLVIPTEDTTRAANVRSYLKKFIHEEEQTAHIGERLAELFGL